MPTQLITLVNHCFVCNDTCSTPQRLRYHLQALHNITVPPRKTGLRHKRTGDITFVTMEPGIQHDNVKQQLACPSCLFYCEQKSDLRTHVEDIHLRKRFFDHSESTPEPVKRGKIVSIPGERHFYTFAASDRQFVPNLPKLTVDLIDKLKDIMTIIMPGNTFLSETSKKILDIEESDQQCLKTLKQFRNAYQLLQSVLQKPHKELPYALWTYQLPSTMSSIETQFTRIVQFVLTDYANKCNRPVEYSIKGERTFWIDRVVPLLQTLGDQTGFVGFEWCETVADEQMESDTVPECWVHGNVRYLDGLGYDRKGRSKIVMESSSGPTAEKVDHTLNDTIKNMHNSIALLEAVVRRNHHARFTTVTKTRAFSLQLIRTTLTLSTTRLDPDSPGKYIVQQHRYAELPTSPNDWIMWYKVFELLALLTTMLEEQTMIIDELRVESSGTIDIAEEEYVCTVISKSPTIPP